jgi:hypothetical protein
VRGVDRTKRPIEHPFARTRRLLEEGRQMAEDTRRILHAARNSRHHAVLLRIISRVLRRARVGQAA